MAGINPEPVRIKPIEGITGACPYGSILGDGSSLIDVFFFPNLEVHGYMFECNVSLDHLPERDGAQHHWTDRVQHHVHRAQALGRASTATSCARSILGDGNFVFEPHAQLKADQPDEALSSLTSRPTTGSI
jgi:hypothetical protein